jgi:hypothetical protein
VTGRVRLGVNPLFALSDSLNPARQPPRPDSGERNNFLKVIKFYDFFMCFAVAGAAYALVVRYAAFVLIP